MTDSIKLLDHFQELYGKEKVLSAHIIPNLGDASELALQKRKLMKKLHNYELHLKEVRLKLFFRAFFMCMCGRLALLPYVPFQTSQRPQRWLNALYKCRDLDAIEHTHREILRVDEQLSRALFKSVNPGLSSTGTAFVTFSSIQAAKHCSKQYK